jgi:outer membrane protein assembly factor BamB
MTPLPIVRNDGTSLVIASGKYYYQVDSKTGEIQWKHRWLTTFGCNAADPIFSDDRVFISSGYNRGSALLKIGEESAEVEWDTKEFQNQWSSSVLVDGFLYGVDGDDTGERTLKCVDFRSGNIRWTYEGLGSASLLAAGDRLIVLGDQGELVIAQIASDEFRPLARAQVLTGKCWTVPVLANGLLYCRNAAGELVCLDLRQP